MQHRLPIQLYPLEYLASGEAQDRPGSVLVQKSGHVDDDEQISVLDVFYERKSLSDELFLHFSSKVQNLTVFSITYMIRIRFLGPW